MVFMVRIYRITFGVAHNVEQNYYNFVVSVNKSNANIRYSDLCHLILHCRYHKLLAYIIEKTTTTMNCQHTLHRPSNKTIMPKQQAEIIFARISLSNVNQIVTMHAQACQAIQLLPPSSTYRHRTLSAWKRCFVCLFFYLFCFSQLLDH